MKKRLLSLVLALALCLGLTVSAMAADTTMKDKNGTTYTSSQPILGTNDSVILHEVDPNGSAWERKGTVYVVPMSAEVYIPAGVIGTAILCIQYSTNQWINIAHQPLNGEAVSCVFDADVYLPDPELTRMTFRGTTLQNSDEVLLIVTSTQDNEIRDLGENGLKVFGDTKTYLENAVLCIVGVKKTSAYPYAPAPVFTDVAIDSPFRDAIAWAVDQNITTGTSATTFSPNETCSRAQILTFLWRANGSPEPADANLFSDIKPTDFYYKAALWAAEKGLVSGSTFDANTNCTRAATVEYLWKVAGHPTTAKEVGFSDVSASANYAQAVAWALERGITSGTSATTFSPDATCTRGQIVTFLHRTMG